MYVAYKQSDIIFFLFFFSFELSRRNIRRDFSYNLNSGFFFFVGFYTIDVYTTIFDHIIIIGEQEGLVIFSNGRPFVHIFFII